MSVFAPMSYSVPGQKQQVLDRLMEQYHQSALRFSGAAGRSPSPFLSSGPGRGVVGLSPQAPTPPARNPVLPPAYGPTFSKMFLPNMMPFGRVSF